jgi:hypothetical protein
MKYPGPKQESVDFDWNEIDPPDDDPDKIAVEVFSSALSWLITFCLSRQRNKDQKTLAGRTNLKAGYRRFIALCYIYRPDLLDGRTIRAVATDLKCSQQEVNKFVTDISLEFKQQGSQQHSIKNRSKFRAAQLRKVAKNNEKRKLNKPFKN